MADKKRVYIPVPPSLLGVVTARYPKISQPDTKGEYADGKYKTEVVADEATTAKFKKWLHEQAASIFPGAKNVNLPIRTKDDVTSFVMKSKNKPLIQDAYGKKVPDSVQIGGGSKIRVAGTLSSYEKGASKGLNIYLDAVQVIELAERGFSGFDAVEGGYTADDTEAEESSAAEAGSDPFAL